MPPRPTSRPHGTPASGWPTSRGDARISWLGRLTEPDTIRELQAADVLCAPSRHGESFGMVLLEAMAAGTPTVASDIPGYRSVSDVGDAVLLVPPGDARGLAGALLRVLSDRRLGARLCAQGDVLVHRFSMDELALRYVGIYRRVMRTGAR